MVDILRLQEYLDEVKEAVPAINITRLVVDDSQIIEIMKDIREKDNLILLAIIPSHSVTGTNIDSLQAKDSMAFLVVKKVDRSLKHTEFINNLHSCQQAIKAVELKLLNDMSNDENCTSIMRQLEPTSINIEPVWGLAGTDGYEINFYLHTSL
jgi:hypothetical protein